MPSHFNTIVLFLLSFSRNQISLQKVKSSLQRLCFNLLVTSKLAALLEVNIIYVEHCLWWQYKEVTINVVEKGLLEI